MAWRLGSADRGALADRAGHHPGGFSGRRPHPAPAPAGAGAAHAADHQLRPVPGADGARAVGLAAAAHRPGGGAPWLGVVAVYRVCAGGVGLERAQPAGRVAPAACGSLSPCSPAPGCAGRQPAPHRPRHAGHRRHRVCGLRPGGATAAGWPARDRADARCAAGPRQPGPGRVGGGHAGRDPARNPHRRRGPARRGAGAGHALDGCAQARAAGQPGGHHHGRGRADAAPAPPPAGAGQRIGRGVLWRVAQRVDGAAA